MTIFVLSFIDLDPRSFLLPFKTRAAKTLAAGCLFHGFDETGAHARAASSGTSGAVNTAEGAKPLASRVELSRDRGHAE